MRKSPAAVERDRLQHLDEVKQELEVQEETKREQLRLDQDKKRERLRGDTELAALDHEARAEGRLVWLEQEVEKLRDATAAREAALTAAAERIAALERGRGGG